MANPTDSVLDILRDVRTTDPDALGKLRVIADDFRATYSATAVALMPAASATDIFTITGSSTKTIKIIEIGISGVRSVAGSSTIQVIKRSTLDSGGTSSVITAVPHISSDPAATASVKAYTANPDSLGTAVGTLRSVAVFLGTTTLNTESGEYRFIFNPRPNKPLTLLNANENVAINLGGTTIAGAALNLWIQWTEE